MRKKSLVFGLVLVMMLAASCGKKPAKETVQPVEIKKEKSGEEKDGFDLSENEGLFFSSLPYFVFESGAGGWSTDLSIASDGTYSGYYHDSDMGDTGDDYPDGTVYSCVFSGRFGNVKKLDEYTYSMEVLSLVTDGDSKEEIISDGVRMVPAEPYGMEDAKELLVYLPGANLKDLPDGFVSWVSAPNAWSENDLPKKLPFYGLYNAAADRGFYGGDSSKVYAAWAKDIKGLSKSDKFSLSKDEYSSDVVFATREKVKDFKILSLTIKDFNENGSLDYDSEVVYTQDELTPEKPLVVKMSFPGDIPTTAISYTEADGTVRTKGVSESGLDGSVVLSDLQSGGGLTEQEAYQYVINYMRSSGQYPDIGDAPDEYPNYIIIDKDKATDNQYVITYRSYTGAFTYFYVDKNTGATQVTEYVPGIIDTETPTGDTFNVNYYKE